MGQIKVASINWFLKIFKDTQTYSTHFIFLTIRLVPGNVVIDAIDMCGKGPIPGEWIYGITWKHVYFNISVLFIVDTTSILKLVFTTGYCSCLDGHLDCCVVAIIVAVVLAVCFIYLFIFSDASTVIFIWEFIKKCWPIWLGGWEDRSIETV